jgi:putative DNA primase/helicase
VYLCRGCGNGNGWTLVQKLFKWDFRTAVEHIEPLVGIGKIKKLEAVPKKDPVPALNYVGKQAIAINWNGSVGKYLRSRGVVDIPVGLKQATLDYFEDGSSKGKYECMLGVIKDFEGNGVSFHITYTKDGKKADLKNSRKIMPPKGTITGSSIRLDVDHNNDENTICVAEGIETAYSASQDCGYPAFAATNAHCLENFIPPNGVECVLIYGDNDASFTGQAAAYILAKRLKMKGLKAFVLIPDKINTDWNDKMHDNFKDFLEN